jgi:hypothetical protein
MDEQIAFIIVFVYPFPLLSSNKSLGLMECENSIFAETEEPVASRSLPLSEAKD